MCIAETRVGGSFYSISLNLDQEPTLLTPHTSYLHQISRSFCAGRRHVILEANRLTLLAVAFRQ